MSIYWLYVYEKKTFYLQNYWSEPVFYTSSYILILLVTSTLLSFRFLRDKLQTQVQLENLEKEKINAELSFLKAQINPHFLFNSLNNILFQIDKSNQNARETLLKFSDMLRYQLYECTSEKIEIEKELKYIINYIEIQMLRRSDKYHCKFNASDRVRNFDIAPLLLIPFIENAFKHVSHHANRKNSIRIEMDYQKGEFIFIMDNDKDNTPAIAINENKGIGITNVKRRLDLLYENKHELEIINGENQFSVMLKLKVDES